jgi:hypothetical protein
VGIENLGHNCYLSTLLQINFGLYHSERDWSRRNYQKRPPKHYKKIQLI